ncbi:Pollen allergen Dac g 2 [Frankliniella fusca]|uniref:Pollen allergen Dac g 2 n=1 Tax=Frankliniella fusca TaxID=407009 RepID=A0AAE1I0E1_9NEOP|nr:Pollen allergen Dac g 2 [Frankliniella fusca]
MGQAGRPGEGGIFFNASALAPLRAGQAWHSGRHKYSGSMRSLAVGVVFGVLAALGASAKRPPKQTQQATKLIFQWLDMVECPELKEQNLSLALRYNKDGDVFADTEWNVVYPAQKITKLRQIMTSCRDDGTACEHFMTWNSPMDGCAFISNKHAVWSPCFANIQPPFICPVEAVHYVNKNWTIDKDLLKLLPFPRGRVYKDRLEMWNEKEELTYCFILSFIWKYIKVRD